MRDLAMLPGLILLVIAIFRHPFIGAPVSLWFSLFGPNAFLYGLLRDFRFVLVFTALTLMAILFQKEETNRRPFSGFALPLAAIFLMTVSFSLSPVAIPAGGDDMSEILKLAAYSLLLLLICTSRQRFEVLLLACFAGVAFYAVLEGGRFLASGGGHHIRGYANYGDNNLIGAAFLTAGPLGFYFLDLAKRFWLRALILGVIGLYAAAIIGTYSRGALIGFIAILPLIFPHLKRGLKISLIVALLLSPILIPRLVPSQWDERMQTIETAGEDESFLGRIKAWKVSLAIAEDRPLLGAGFRAVQDPGVWAKYALRAKQFDFMPEADPTTIPFKAAHSLFFQVLGDLGFLGLGLYLAMIVLTFRRLGRVIRLAKSAGDERWRNAGVFLRIGFAGNCVAGAAVSIAYTDLFFFFITAAILAERLTKQAYASARVPEPESGASEPEAPERAAARSASGASLA